MCNYKLRRVIYARRVFNCIPNPHSLISTQRFSSWFDIWQGGRPSSLRCTLGSNHVLAQARVSPKIEDLVYSLQFALTTPRYQYFCNSNQDISSPAEFTSTQSPSTAPYSPQIHPVWYATGPLRDVHLH